MYIYIHKHIYIYIHAHTMHTHVYTYAYKYIYIYVYHSKSGIDRSVVIRRYGTSELLDPDLLRRYIKVASDKCNLSNLGMD